LAKTHHSQTHWNPTAFCCAPASTSYPQSLWPA
jgi:hypothetical protein